MKAKQPPRPVKAVKAWAIHTTGTNWIAWGELVASRKECRAACRDGEVPMRVVVRPAPKRVLFDALADESLFATMAAAKAAALKAWSEGKKIRVIVVEEL